MYVQIHAPRIVMAKISLYVPFNNIINSLISKTANKRGEIFKTTGVYIFLRTTILSNSQLLIFYSEQTYITVYGNATNWNSTGYWDEVFQPLSKCGE